MGSSQLTGLFPILSCPFRLESSGHAKELLPREQKPLLSRMRQPGQAEQTEPPTPFPESTIAGS